MNVRRTSRKSRPCADNHFLSSVKFDNNDPSCFTVCLKIQSQVYFCYSIEMHGGYWPPAEVSLVLITVPSASHSHSFLPEEKWIHCFHGGTGKKDDFCLLVFLVPPLSVPETLLAGCRLVSSQCPVGMGSSFSSEVSIRNPICSRVSTAL